MSEWQPIETAPKDGTHVIVAKGKRVFVAWFDDLEDQWLDSINHNGYEDSPVEPTLWTPWPAPPT